MATVRELVTKWAFDADTQKVEQFNKGLNNASKKMSDVGGKFQFNGIDLERDFDAGFLLGVTPNELFFLYLSKCDLHPKLYTGFSKWTLHPMQLVSLTEENFWASWTALNLCKKVH